MSGIADLSKVRNPQARTAQSGPSKSTPWPRTVRTDEGSCGFVRRVSEKCGEKVGPKTDVDPFSLTDVQRILATVRADYKQYFVRYAHPLVLNCHKVVRTSRTQLTGPRQT